MNAHVMLYRFWLDYLDYREGFEHSSFAPYLRPLTYGDWLQFFDVWQARHASTQGR